LQTNITSKEAAGLTVNERLWLSGRMQDFDDAIAETNEAEFKVICKSVFLDESSINVLVAKYFG
jgi:hypothetical protein